MGKTKRKMKKKLRDFRIWIVKKSFPDKDLSFLFDPLSFELGLVQMQSEKEYTNTNYEFMSTKHIKEVLVSKMIPNLVNHIDYEVVREGDKVICKGELTVAERRVQEC